jgi:deoxyribonuclease-4
MPPRKPSPVGAHIFVGGGLAKVGLPYARDIGAEVVQVFVSNPRGWALGPGDPLQDKGFRDGCGEDGIGVYVHAPYLINFGSPTPATLEKSAECLRHSIRRGREIGARGVVVHAGCEVAGDGTRDVLGQIREHLRPIVGDLRDDDPDVLIELMAGGRGAMAASPEALPPYLAALEDHPKAGVCVDTCHAMAAGHDLAKPGGLRSFLSAVVKHAGRDRLRLVHANDSKDPVGSGRDRHEVIGKGTIGKDTFRELFVHPAMKGVPVLMETPGVVAEHRRDLRALKRLRTDALLR